MKFAMLESSIVVLAEQHNPTILHPAFLEAQNIVDSSWELAEPPICTPPFAIVKYKNGITFSAEFTKLQVIDSGPSHDFSITPIAGLILAYIKKLPFVAYNALGINFTGFIPLDNSNQVLTKKFLKDGTWNQEPYNLKSVGLRLTYPIEDTILKIEIDSNRIKRPSDPTDIEGILVKANFHSALSQTNSLSQAEKKIGKFINFGEIFTKQITDIFKL